MQLLLPRRDQYRVQPIRYLQNTSGRCCSLSASRFQWWFYFGRKKCQRSICQSRPFVSVAQRSLQWHEFVRSGTDLFLFLLGVTQHRFCTSVKSICSSLFRPSHGDRSPGACHLPCRRLAPTVVCSKQRFPCGLLVPFHGEERVSFCQSQTR